MNYFLIGVILFSLLSMVLTVGLVLYRKRVWSEKGMQDISELIADSIVDLVQGKDFTSLLRVVNEAVGSRCVILIFYHNQVPMDFRFYSRDPGLRILIPEPGMLQKQSPVEEQALLEELRLNQVVCREGPYRSLYGGVEGNNAIILGFTFQKQVYAVLQFIQRDKPFCDKESYFNPALLKSLNAATLRYYLDYVQTEKRRNAVMALRKSEELYRLIFEDSMDMVYHTDREGNILAINHAGVGMLGYESEMELKQKRLHDFFFDAEQRSLYFDLIRKQGQIKDMEVILVSRKGEKIFCLESASASFDGTGEVKSYTGIVKDISEHIALDRELYKANIDLTEANTQLKKAHAQVVQAEKMASIGQLAAGLAHEINNPLGFVRSNFSTLRRYSDFLTGFADDITGRITPEKNAALKKLRQKYRIDDIKEDLEAVFSETEEGMERMMEIVQNLRNFSHDSRAGDVGELDLNKALKSSLVIARNEIKYHASVSLDLKPLPEVRCRPGEVKQIILNMIINAAQAVRENTPRDTEGRIRVSSFAEGDFVCFSIEDSGPGIPPEIRNRIFDPFYTTKDVGSGTGLGLSISYDIVVHKHHGRIHVDDSPLGGVKFTVMLPRVGLGSDEELGELEELDRE
ncbi:ATP-binding protein [Marispirochaeta sp.]|uniref:sensor histidine kinase n=1 Tax=Marispirochaeta sp. TaxID=2038653 RepID=UPI0029C8CEDD|nr:ATP-binding protein [Marispirochaeta sp.]